MRKRPKSVVQSSIATGVRRSRKTSSRGAEPLLVERACQLDAAAHDDAGRVRLRGRIVGRDPEARCEAADEVRCRRPEVRHDVGAGLPLAWSDEAVRRHAECLSELSDASGHEHGRRSCAVGEDAGEGDVVLESPRGEEQGGRLGGETRDEPPEGVGGGIRRDADRTALAPRRRFRARSDGGREAARAPAEDEDGAVRNPAERRLEVTARRRENADGRAESLGVNVVRRAAVVPEDDAVRLGDRRDRARESARVWPGQEIDPAEQVFDLLARGPGGAPVVAHDQLHGSASGPCLVRPELEPAPRAASHRREGPRERHGEPDPQQGYPRVVQ